MTGSGGRVSDGPGAGYTISARMVDTSRFFRFLTVIRVRAVSAQSRRGNGFAKFGLFRARRGGVLRSARDDQAGLRGVAAPTRAMAPRDGRWSWAPWTASVPLEDDSWS